MKIDWVEKGANSMESAILIQELANGQKVLTGLIEGISQAAAQLKPDLKTWSILEVICHLYDEEREDFRVRLDTILNHPAEAWPPIRPEEWVMERAYNEQDLAAMVQKFREERQASLQWLKKLDSPDWEASIETPWGAMKAGDMLAAWVAHDNLHMRQLVELRRWRIEQIAAPYQLRYAGEW